MRFRMAMAVLLVAAFLAACAAPAPTPTPTPRPTATPAPTNTPAPTATPTSIFHEQVSGQSPFPVSVEASSLFGGETRDPQMVREEKALEIKALAERIDSLVKQGRLPKETKGDEVVFTSNGERVGAIVVHSGKAWKVTSEGNIVSWANQGAFLAENCLFFIERDNGEGRLFLLEDGQKLFRVEATDATGFVARLVRLDGNSNPIAGTEETMLLMSASSGSEGAGILRISGARFLATPAGMELTANGFIDPVDGVIRFRDGANREVAVWNPLTGRWLSGGPDRIFAPIPETGDVLVGNDFILTSTESAAGDLNETDKIVLSIEPGSNTRIFFFQTEPDYRFAYMGILNPANTDVKIPSNRSFAIELPIHGKNGTIVFRKTGALTVKVYFGLNKDQAVEYDPEDGKLEGHLGDVVYPGAGSLEGILENIFPEGDERRTMPILIGVLLEEPREINKEEMEHLFKEIVLKEKGRYVFLDE